MDSIFSLLFVMGVNSPEELDQNYYDIVGKLPVEVAVMILRKLDSRTLVSASRVNRRWFHLCKFDRVLRERVRDEIYRQRIQHIMPLNVQILRNTQNVQRPFSSLNGFQQKRVIYTGRSSENMPTYDLRLHSYKMPGKQKKSLRAENLKYGHNIADSKSNKKGLRF